MLKHLEQYSAYVRKSPEILDYVLAQGLRIKKDPIRASTVIVFATAPKRRNAMWNAVWPFHPSFEEKAKDCIRSGFLPLGTVDLASSRCDVFGDIVPKAYLDDVCLFARAQFQSVVDANQRDLEREQMRRAVKPGPTVASHVQQSRSKSEEERQAPLECFRPKRGDIRKTRKPKLLSK
jgi:hypothetical protein